MLAVVCKLLFVLDQVVRRIGFAAGFLNFEFVYRAGKEGNSGLVEVLECSIIL
jgi:hypothetical protein